MSRVVSWFSLLVVVLLGIYVVIFGAYGLVLLLGLMALTTVLLFSGDGRVSPWDKLVWVYYGMWFALGLVLIAGALNPAFAVLGLEMLMVVFVSFLIQGFLILVMIGPPIWKYFSRQSMKFRVVVMTVVAVALASGYYFFEWRPGKIKTECNTQAKEEARGILRARVNSEDFASEQISDYERDRYRRMAKNGSYITKDFSKQYAICLKARGLEF